MPDVPSAPVRPGQAVTWLYAPDGPHGQTIPVAAEVVQVLGASVVIVAHFASGRVSRVIVPSAALEPAR